MGTPWGGRLSDSHEPREDHYATSGGKERMTGTEHQTIMADAAQNRQVPGLDYPTVLHRVAEGAVRQAHGDRIAAAQRVEMAEGRAVGGPVPCDGRGGVLARQRRAGDQPRALAQIGG